MKLNGWQRLWIVVTLGWAVCIALFVWAGWPLAKVDADVIGSALIVWIVPSVSLYLTGLAWAWVRRGFSTK
jgi:hypothetical protein